MAATDAPLVSGSQSSMVLTSAQGQAAAAFDRVKAVTLAVLAQARPRLLPRHTASAGGGSASCDALHRCRAAVGCAPRGQRQRRGSGGARHAREDAARLQSPRLVTRRRRPGAPDSAQRRPWNELADRTAYQRPADFSEARAPRAQRRPGRESAQQLVLERSLACARSACDPHARRPPRASARTFTTSGRAPPPTARARRRRVGNNRRSPLCLWHLPLQSHAHAPADPLATPLFLRFARWLLALPPRARDSAGGARSLSLPPPLAASGRNLAPASRAGERAGELPDVADHRGGRLHAGQPRRAARPVRCAAPRGLVAAATGSALSPFLPPRPQGWASAGATCSWCGRSRCC